jgi:hypothetical protein
MGRLSQISGTSISFMNCPDIINPSCSGETTPLKILNTSNKYVISGVTITDIHVFVDEYGNVTQIKKEAKPRLKYCPDPKYPQTELINICAIGVSDEEWGECSDGTAMGIGDYRMAYAKYI